MRRQTTWPDEDPTADGYEEMVMDHDEDSGNFVVADLQQRATADAANEAARVAQRHTSCPRPPSACAASDLLPSPSL